MRGRFSGIVLSFFLTFACVCLTTSTAQADDCFDDIKYCDNFPSCIAACTSQDYQRLNITCREWQKNAWDSEEICVQNSQAKLENCKNVCKYKFHKEGPPSSDGNDPSNSTDDSHDAGSSSTGEASNNPVRRRCRIRCSDVYLRCDDSCKGSSSPESSLSQCWDACRTDMNGCKDACGN
jgi:hypothetical protein